MNSFMLPLPNVRFPSYFARRLHRKWHFEMHMELMNMLRNLKIFFRFSVLGLSSAGLMSSWIECCS